MSRKIIQISGDYDKVYALCDDGSLWHCRLSFGGDSWKKYSNIPQD